MTSISAAQNSDKNWLSLLEFGFYSHTQLAYIDSQFLAHFAQPIEQRDYSKLPIMLE